MWPFRENVETTDAERRLYEAIMEERKARCELIKRVTKRISDEHSERGNHQ